MMAYQTTRAMKGLDEIVGPISGTLSNTIQALAEKYHSFKENRNPVVGYYRDKPSLLERTLNLTVSGGEKLVAAAALPTAFYAAISNGDYIRRVTGAISSQYDLMNGFIQNYLMEGAASAVAEAAKSAAGMAIPLGKALIFEPETAATVFALTYLGMKAVPMASTGIRHLAKYLKRIKVRKGDIAQIGPDGHSSELKPMALS